MTEEPTLRDIPATLGWIAQQCRDAAVEPSHRAEVRDRALARAGGALEMLAALWPAHVATGPVVAPYAPGPVLTLDNGPSPLVSTAEIMAALPEDERGRSGIDDPVEAVRDLAERFTDACEGIAELQYWRHGVLYALHDGQAPEGEDRTDAVVARVRALVDQVHGFRRNVAVAIGMDSDNLENVDVVRMVRDIRDRGNALRKNLRETLGLSATASDSAIAAEVRAPVHTRDAPALDLEKTARVHAVLSAARTVGDAWGNADRVRGKLRVTELDALVTALDAMDTLDGVTAS